jgi:hypothetical protein
VIVNAVLHFPTLAEHNRRNAGQDLDVVRSAEWTHYGDIHGPILGQTFPIVTSNNC